jgi:hypothetical protein
MVLVDNAAYLFHTSHVQHHRHRLSSMSAGPSSDAEGGEAHGPTTLLGGEKSAEDGQCSAHAGQQGDHGTGASGSDLPGAAPDTPNGRASSDRDSGLRGSSDRDSSVANTVTGTMSDSAASQEGAYKLTIRLSKNKRQRR